MVPNVLLPDLDQNKARSLQTRPAASIILSTCQRGVKTLGLDLDHDGQHPMSEVHPTDPILAAGLDLSPKTIHPVRFQ
jgi:hypothetical protein